MATELAAFITEKKIPVAYIHNELNTIERHKVINDLRRGKYVAIIGINLLREGLDVPEVSLVAIFDADTSGLFRSQTSLIQTIGRAARNANGRVIMYAKAISKDMAVAIDETNRRRLIQVEYNKKHHITPTTIIKPIRDDLKSNKQELIVNEFLNRKIKNTTKIKELLAKLRDEMLVAASKKEYERAAALRDYIFEIEKNNNIKDK
jgi:excinuclease ABC subunit B